MATVEAHPQITLHLPPDVPGDTVLNVMQETLDDYNTLLSQLTHEHGIALTVSMPERHFLIEVGTITLVVTITVGGTAGAGAVYALKKAIDVISEIVKTKKTEDIRRQNEIDIAKIKAEIEVEKERRLLSLRQPSAPVPEDVTTEPLLTELRDHTISTVIRTAVVERLRHQGYNVF